MVTSRKSTATRKVARKTSGAPSPTRPIAEAETPQSVSPPAAPVPADAPAPVPAVPAAKQKLVRDSFTIPEVEYAALTALKARLVALARPTRKSELLRAGIRALGGLTDAALIDAVGLIETLRTGRPKATAKKAPKTSKKKR